MAFSLMQKSLHSSNMEFAVGLPEGGFTKSATMSMKNLWQEFNVKLLSAKRLSSSSFLRLAAPTESGQAYMLTENAWQTFISFSFMDKPFEAESPLAAAWKYTTKTDFSTF